GSDALLERVLARAKRLQQLPPLQARQPLVPQGMAGDFVAAPMDPLDLRRIVVGTGPGQGGLAHDREAGAHVLARQKREQALRVLELERPPALRAARRARAVASPL